jgi:hypothetical protein
MQKLMVMVCALVGVGVFTTLAMSAEDLAKAVKERRHLMKDIVRVDTKLGGEWSRAQYLTMPPSSRRP